MEQLIDALTPRIRISLQRSIAETRLGARRLTSRIRMAPDLLIIGAQRAGTSSLYKYLSQHPLVLPPLYKETSYFSQRYRNGVHWYHSHFPTQLRNLSARRMHAPRRLTFEATPNYLFHPYASTRAWQTVPQAKIIVLLRNPVDRAFSHYQHMCRHGYEDLSFEEALAQEPERLAPEWKRLQKDPLYDCQSLLRFSYVSRGIYISQLEMWMESFPPDRFLIIKSEDFYSSPATIYQEVIAFLGLPSWQPREFPNYSRGRNRDKLSVAPSTRCHLVETFAPHNQRLYELLNRDFEWDC